MVKAAVRDYFEKLIGKWYQYEIRNGKLVLKSEEEGIVSINVTKNIAHKPSITPPKITSNPNNTENKLIPTHPLPNKPLSVPSLSGKTPVTDKMMKDFKTLIIDRIRTERIYPFSLLKLKNDTCEVLGITQGTKPYLGKFSQYIESIITEYQLFVKIEGPNLVLVQFKK